MKAIFSPGLSYHDPEVRKYAGWVKVLDLYKEALEELGYEVFIPQVPSELVDEARTVSKVLSYDLVAATLNPPDAELFLGPPGYSLIQMMMLPKAKKFLFVWNNADWWRDRQLANEYKEQDAFYDLSQSWRWINRTALLKCDHVIACSPWVKWTHEEIVGKGKVSIAFWGVDSQRFQPAAVEPPEFRVLFVGGDPIRKGLKYLLWALAGVDSAYELWIAGCRPISQDKCPPHWKQLGMVPHDEMPKIYRQCSILVIPTLEDGIALAIQEGMASGLVPITSPETAEVFDDGISGFKVDYRDVEGIRKHILKLRDNKELRQYMSREARKKAESQPWSMTKEQFKEIIRKRMG